MRLLSFEKLYSAKPHIGSYINHGKEMCGKKLPFRLQADKRRTKILKQERWHLPRDIYSLFPPKHLYRLSGLVPPCWEISGICSTVICVPRTCFGHSMTVVFWAEKDSRLSETLVRFGSL